MEGGVSGWEAVGERGSDTSAYGWERRVATEERRGEWKGGGEKTRIQGRGGQGRACGGRGESAGGRGVEEGEMREEAAVGLPDARRQRLLTKGANLSKDVMFTQPSEREQSREPIVLLAV